jgi:hypothetical protein
MRHVSSINLLFFRLYDPPDGGTTVFETLETTHPMTQHYNPLDFNPALNTKIKK